MGANGRSEYIGNSRGGKYIFGQWVPPLWITRWRSLIHKFENILEHSAQQPLL